MALLSFNGKTFVAFLDISGFKEKMKNNQEALETLNHFYQIGFDLLEGQKDVEGIFISDCGILFVRETNCLISEQLDKLLTLVKSINKKVLEKDIMLTTSIAYGPFSYQEKIEFQGIEKNQIHGYAYLDAFLDNEKGLPKIQPGQCRILKKNLPNELVVDNPFIRKKSKHYYYYWNVNQPEEIDGFLIDYNDSYNQKYLGFERALKKYCI